MELKPCPFCEEIPEYDKFCGIHLIYCKCNEDIVDVNEPQTKEENDNGELK